MSKNLTPFSCDDISALAKSLRKQLQQHESFPSHVEMLNILAKACGLQNFQQLRQQHAEQLLSAQPELTVPIPKRLKPFMRSDYIMHSWPAKYAIQQLSLWFFWCRFQYLQSYSEQQVNGILSDYLDSLDFKDFALIRRELCNHKLLKRTDDGRTYWRASATPAEGFEPLADFWPSQLQSNQLEHDQLKSDNEES
ncbi:DUF2087 domain-containing protein [Shewanella sp. D64]|uniref:DUF2087 domain-containing protein n=1 Tax=unclassified Shewanella TaxID=196818 RepID=UPI0022BA33EC|nr:MULTISPECIES: DUF2087 domain-containing protein [unclassified Shewanella]MEC4727644.1 DUF2087 domain-containing protein [Shewanella sp. D64]MEC4739783.1 DUF2087 domain-containing protein [Shewanella sp. E94]WBJ94043.1 DUF2087 domain-containing protein [Shewanella sp. MTB7]